MKWKAFFQIVLLIIVTAVIFNLIFPLSSLINSGLYPFRYQYIGKEVEETNIDFPDGTAQTIPNSSWGVFDRWTGKVYKFYDIPENAIMKMDVINRKIELLPLRTEISADIDWENLEEQITKKFQIQSNKKREEILKILLKNK